MTEVVQVPRVAEPGSKNRQADTETGENNKKENSFLGQGPDFMEKLLQTIQTLQTQQNQQGERIEKLIQNQMQNQTPPGWALNWRNNQSWVTPK